VPIDYYHADVSGSFLGGLPLTNRLEFLNVLASQGDDTINVNDTTTTNTTTVDSYLGDDTITINGTNLSANNIFLGNDGNDQFNLKINGIGNSIGQFGVYKIASLDIEGGNNAAGMAGDSVNRDRLTVSDTSLIGRALDYIYLNEPGGMNVAT